MRPAELPRPSSWLTLAAAALALSTCTPEVERPPLPEGTYVTGDAAALTALLTGLEGLRDTPIARESARLKAALKGCEAFEQHLPGGGWEGLFAEVHCIPAGSQPPSVQARLGDQALLISSTLGEDGAFVATGNVGDDGALQLSGLVDPPPSSGAFSLILPAPEGAGAPQLSTDGTLFHVRLRPEGGLNLAALVPEGSQAEDMFKLKSDLFTGAVLAGAWEMAIYEPEPGMLWPPSALGLDIRSQRLATAAMETFITQLSERWPIRRTNATFGEYPGACLPNLKILPDFSPCYVATGGALVVGWNRVSIERALQPMGEVPPPPSGGATLFLDRLPAADRHLHDLLLPDAPFVPQTYAWRRARLRLERQEEGIAFYLNLTVSEAP